MGLEISFADLHDTTTFFSGEYDVSSVFVTIGCALSIYNGLELLLLVFTTFRRFQGLYFWSLLVASFGLLPYTIGLMIMYFTFINSRKSCFRQAPPLSTRLITRVAVAGLIFTTFGWPMLVTGQSLVLYSRLHVVLGQENRKLLKGVKWMIVINAIVFHLSTIVVLFGAYYATQQAAFADAYKYIEKIQMTGFTIQELILSGLYVWKTLDIIHVTSNAATAGTVNRKKRTSRIMWQLFSINVLIVIMDVALLVIEYQDRHVFQQALKGVIYSVKLKMEFAILSKLVALTSRDGGSSQATFTGAFEDYNGEDDSSHRERTTRGRSRLGQERPVEPVKNARLDLEKHEMAYVERASGSGDGLTLDGAPLARHTTRCSIAPATTVDEQQKRRTIDEDLYASALRGLSG
jgi:hypothetical protein